MAPFVGDISCVMHLNVVVFPAPFNPNNPKHSPGSTQKFKFFIATILFSLLQQAQFFLNSFLIFFNRKEYLEIFLAVFSLVITISSSFALSISFKTRLSLTSGASLLL